jgi:hypothetical protein
MAGTPALFEPLRLGGITLKASPRLRSGTPCLGPEVSKVQKGTVSVRDGYLHQSRSF